ncbi:unnamed protein product [Lactuca saligna]|uniref:Uncharacterized protein n=1 Tax=Lactuca saligna TaxID=75948 RepID=A0AA35Z8T0_LACSI|nr:unnamed protein product [Lactuca saligna]
MLFSFHLMHMKPQYETWSSKKISVMKVSGSIKTKSFANARFKVARGAGSSLFEFTLVDLLCLNPYDWISLEIGKWDIDIAVVLRKKPSVLPTEAPKDFRRMKLGRIRKDGWCMTFQIKERFDVDYHRVCFYLSEKHLYSIPCLQYIMEFMGQCLNWYIEVLKTFLNIMPKFFEV